MADGQKLTQLTATTEIADDDLLYVVRDPAGLPVERKITGANLKTALGSSGDELTNLFLPYPRNQTLAWDDFQRADGPLGVSPSGHTWETIPGNQGEPDIVDNSAGHSANSIMLLNPDPGRTDWQIESWVTSSNSWFILILAWIDANNYIGVQYSSGTTGTVFSVIDGVTTSLASSSNSLSGTYARPGRPLLLAADIVVEGGLLDIHLTVMANPRHATWTVRQTSGATFDLFKAGTITGKIGMKMANNVDSRSYGIIARVGKVPY